MLRFSTIIKGEAQITRKRYASSFVLRERIFTLCRHNDGMGTVNNADVISLRDVHYAANITRGFSPFTVGIRKGSTWSVLNHAAFVSKLDEKEEKPGLLQMTRPVGTNLKVVQQNWRSQRCQARSGVRRGGRSREGSNGNANLHEVNPFRKFRKFRHFPNIVLSRDPHMRLTYRFYEMRENIKVNADEGNKTYWLTFKDRKLSFEPSRDPEYSLFNMYKYNVTPEPVLSTCTPIILVPQKQSQCGELCMPLAVDATSNDEIVMSPFSPAYFMGEKISPNGCGKFLKVFTSNQGEGFYNIQSSQTSSFMSIASMSSDQLAPIMSNIPRAIRLNEVDSVRVCKY